MFSGTASSGLATGGVCAWLDRLAQKPVAASARERIWIRIGILLWTKRMHDVRPCAGRWRFSLTFLQPSRHPHQRRSIKVSDQMAAIGSSLRISTKATCTLRLAIRQIQWRDLLGSDNE